MTLEVPVGKFSTNAGTNFLKEGTGLLRRFRVHVMCIRSDAVLKMLPPPSATHIQEFL